MRERSVPKTDGVEIQRIAVEHFQSYVCYYCNVIDPIELRRTLSNHNLSQRQFAELARVSLRTIQRACAGSTTIKRHIWRKIMRGLKRV